MPKAATRPRAKKPAASTANIDQQAAAAIAALKRAGTKKTRDGMARYAIPSDKAFGVPFAAVQKMGKALAPDHALAQALWDTGWYEARLMAAFVDDPGLVTAAQMHRWCAEFENWAVCDTVLFKARGARVRGVPGCVGCPGAWGARVRGVLLGDSWIPATHSTHFTHFMHPWH